jgi:peptidoglycan/LPS O-acetylase OafA/YrhL
MSDPTPAPLQASPPPPVQPQPPKNRGLGWFFAVSGSVVLLLTLGCILAVTEGNLFGDMGGVAILCGSPTLVLGGVFLWLGSRRLKR